MLRGGNRAGLTLGAINTQAKRFVYRISTLVRTARIHAMSNQAMNYSLTVAANTSTKLVQLLGTVSLIGEGEVVHVNEFRLKVDRAMTRQIQLLNDYMHERGLGGFIVDGAVQAEEWRAVITVLMDAEEVVEEADNSAKLNLVLSDAGVGHVRFAPPLRLRTGTLGHVFGGEGQSVRIAAGRALALYVRACRALAATQSKRHKTRQVVNLSRVVQQLVELADDEPRHHLALICMKDASLDYQLRHPVNVCILALALGHRVGLSRSSLLDLGISCLVADIGMLDLDQELREKPGPFTRSEREELLQHVSDSVQFSIRGRQLDLAARRRSFVAFEHHMGFDASGYPDALHWEEPHLFSRMFAICELYDALTTTTPWRNAMLQDEAMTQVVEQAGHSLDPALVAAFVNMIGRYPLGTAVLLDNGEVGVVYLNHPDPAEASRPIVRVVVDSQGQPVRQARILDLRDRADGGYERSIVRSVAAESLGIDLKRALYA